MAGDAYLLQRIALDTAGQPLPSLRGVVLSADGKRVASFGEPEDPRALRQVQVHDRASGILVRAVGDHEEAIRAIVMAPDGRWVISTSFDVSNQTGSTTCWNLTDGTRMWTLPEGGESLTLSDDAAAVSLALPDQVRVLRTDTGVETQRFLAPTQSLYYSPLRGQMLTVIRRNDVRLVDVRNQQELGVYTGCERTPRVAAISPDGRLIAAGDRTEIVLWETAGGRVVHRLAGHAGRVMRLVFSPDNRFVIAGDVKGRLHAWHLASGTRVLQFSGHQSLVSAIHWQNSNDELTTGSTDRTIAIWSTDLLLQSPWKTAPTAAEQLAAIWDQLGSGDAGAAFRSVGQISEFAEQLIPAMRTRVEQITLPAQKRRILQLVEELKDRDYAVRFRAAKELRKLRSVAMATLEQIYADATSPLQREQLARILALGTGGPRFTDEDVRRMQRLAWALEQAGTDDAVLLLETIAADFPEPTVIAAAQSALKTIRQRR